MKLLVKTKRTEKVLSNSVSSIGWSKNSKHISLSSGYPHYSLSFKNNDEIDSIINKLNELKEHG